MKIDMLMPQMGESITEATIARWLKQPGEMVEKDEIILEISTDKVDSEIPAPGTGCLSEVLFNEGDVVPVNEKIAVIDTEAKETTGTSSKKDSPAAPEKTPPRTPSAPPSPPSQSSGSTTDGVSDRPVSPLVKNLALKAGVSLSELSSIPGSGAGGRVTKNDFLAFVDSRKTQAPSASKPSGTSPTTASAPSKGSAPVQTGSWLEDGTQVVPMDRMRKAIAEHMVRSKHTSPHVYSVQEVDVSKIAAWRAKHKAAFKKKEGFNLSFTPFFLEAAVKALMHYPIVNSSIRDNSIIMKKHVNLGCAVALGTSGLIVPVIKKAEELTLAGIARSLNDLALRARDRKLLPDDVAGGTFTVTNPGIFGTIIGTPIINQPQSAILCLGAIKKRPIVVDDMIAIREMVYLTLSYDHRNIDGSAGGSFLKFVREYLENWDMDRDIF